jgi:hypothetical protein
MAEQLFAGWNRLVDQAINKAWDLGHLLLGFEEDSDTSIVSECLRCGALASVDGDEACGRALTIACGGLTMEPAGVTA